MIIAVDAAGGDHYPKNPILGALEAIEEFDNLTVLLVGPEKLVQSELSQHHHEQSRIQILDAPQVVDMTDSASLALKQKPNSLLQRELRYTKRVIVMDLLVLAIPVCF